MTKKILIISATLFEIEYLLQKFKNLKMSKMQIDLSYIKSENDEYENINQNEKILKKCSIFIFEKKSKNIQIFVFYTGMGKNNATKNLDAFLQFYRQNLGDESFDKIFLIGISLSINGILKIGDIVEPNIVVYEDEKIELFKKDRETILLTVDKFVDIEKKYEILKKNKFKNLEVVDMETFYWVKSFSTFYKKFDMNNINIFKCIGNELDYKFSDIFINSEKQLKPTICEFITNNKKMNYEYLKILLKNFKYNIFKVFKQIKQIRTFKKNFYLARKNLSEFILERIL
ncbi:MAG: hypothetical protein LBF97_07230 [Elusimicrobiota bacterium]|jgi:nucleoside phosphorylase|nr:hypothetical protein [Elusimicrobiota bacterium]